MDFFDNPDVLSTGTRYKGAPATFGELTESVSERQRLIDANGALERQLWDAFDKRDSELEKAGLGKLGNPFRRTPTPDEIDRITKSAFTQGDDLTSRIGKPFWMAPKNDDFVAAYFLREYEEQLKELQRKRPDLAHVIRAERPPMAEVAETMRGADKRADDAQQSRNNAYSWLNPYRVAEGTAATLIGTLYGSRESPLDIASNLVGLDGRPWMSLLKNYLRSAASNAAMQAVLEPSTQAARQAVGLDAGIMSAFENIAMSGLAGGAIDTAFRAPVRALNKARGVEGLGGILRDAPDPTAPAPRPESTIPVEPARPTEAPAIDPELLRRATEEGDPVAMREIMARFPELAEEPEIRGAVAMAEREALLPSNIEGVDNGAGLRALSQTLLADLDPQEPRPRAPTDLPPARVELDPDRAARVMAEPEVARVLDGARQLADQAIPGLSERLEALIDAGHPRVLDAIEDGVKKARAGDDVAKIAEAFTREAVSLAQEIGPERLAALAGMHSGLAGPLDVARAVRAMPDLIDASVPMTESVRMGQSLARLSEDAFGMVERGEANPEIARVVSDHVADEARHAGILKDLSKANITDPDQARRTIPDLLPPEREPDAMPLDRGSTMDDPAGKEAQAQVERLKAEYAPEIAESAAALQQRKIQAETAAKIEQAKQEAMAQADAVRAAIEAETAMGGNTPVRVFTAMGDLPPEVAGDVMRGNAQFFTGALRNYLAAQGDSARLAAIADMDRAARLQGIEGFYRDGTVWLAAYAENPNGRYVHELVHALTDAGQLTRAEVAELAMYARSLGVFSPERESLYRQAYASNTPERLAEMLDEEAAAHLMEAKRKGELPEPKAEAEPAPEAARVDGIVARVQAFMARIADAVRRALGQSSEIDANSPGSKPNSVTDKPNSASGILDQLLSGEIAKRERVAQVLRSEDVSAVAVREPQMMAAFADRDTGQSMRRDLDALGYYSQALEAARGLKQAKGTPEQMLAQLKSAGVKDAEIEATNLRSFFDGKKSVTRDEIVSHLEANRVGLRESARYKTPPADIQTRPNPNDASLTDVLVNGEQAAQIYRDADHYVIEMEDGDQAHATTFEQALEYVRKNDAGLTNQTKWSSYSLDPSNPSYRETVLHLPKEVQTFTPEWLSFVAEMKAKYSAGDDWWTFLDAEESRKRMLLGDQLPVPQDPFRSGHFPEPNIIGHMMTSMVKHEGKPTYLIDQIQSDWGQKLRDGGVRDEQKAVRLRQEIDAKFPQLSEASRRGGPGGNSEQALEERRALPPEQLAELSRLRAELHNAVDGAIGNPLVNTTDQWVNTTLRRALRQAAEADAAYIAIPHGDTVLSYNPGDENGMRGFYGSRTSEGIVPKNLRKLLEKIDKTIRPVKVEKLETSRGPEGWQGEHKERNTGRRLVDDRQMHNESRIDKDQTGFTLFPLTDKVKAEVKDRGQAMFAFAGERAKTAKKEAFDLARKMEAEAPPRVLTKGAPGYDAYEAHRWKVWEATHDLGQGLFLAVDGKWRFEIDDSRMTAVRGTFVDAIEQGGTRPFGLHLNHPELFSAYPLTERTPVTMTGGTGALYSRGEIRTSSPRTDVLMHEMQHLIQDKEGFARGGSVAEFANTAPRKLTNGGRFAWTGDEPSAIEKYRSLSGEVEARTVEKRMKMSPEERRARPPWLDYDIPEDQQIVRFADGASVSQHSYSEPPPVDGPAMRGTTMFAIRAFHGTTHDFDRFDLSKIGTGEGFQVFGRGIYFTEREELAKEYARRVTKMRNPGAAQITLDGVPFTDRMSLEKDTPEASAQHEAYRKADAALYPLIDAIKRYKKRQASFFRRDRDREASQFVVLTGMSEDNVRGFVRSLEQYGHWRDYALKQPEFRDLVGPALEATKQEGEAWRAARSAREAAEQKRQGSLPTIKSEWMRAEDIAEELGVFSSWPQARKDLLKRAQNDGGRLADDVSDSIRDFVAEFDEYDKQGRLVFKPPEVWETGQRLYEVSINADDQEMLLWDRSLADQSDFVRQAMQRGGNKAIGVQGQSILSRIFRRSQVELKVDQYVTSTDSVGAYVRSKEDQEKLRKELLQLGIKGIKYLDRGSRQSGDGTYNFVVFDDSLIEIVAKDGRPIEKAERQQVIDGMSAKPQGDTMFAMADQTPDPISTLARSWMDAQDALQSASNAVAIERDADGRISLIRRGSKTYAVTRDAEGKVATLDLSEDLQAQVQVAYSNLTAALAERIPPEQLANYAALIDTARNADVTEMAARLSEAEVNGRPLAEQIFTVRAAMEQAIGPEQTQGLIDTVLAQVPEPAQTALRQLIDQAQPEPEASRMSANDNVDLGPMSPVEEGLFDMERIGAIIELIGVCRG